MYHGRHAHRPGRHRAERPARPLPRWVVATPATAAVVAATTAFAFSTGISPGLPSESADEQVSPLLLPTGSPSATPGPQHAQRRTGVSGRVSESAGNRADESPRPSESGTPAPSPSGGADSIASPQPTSSSTLIATSPTPARSNSASPSPSGAVEQIVATATAILDPLVPKLP